jgi:hypothetical protein
LAFFPANEGGLANSSCISRQVYPRLVGSSVPYCDDKDIFLAQFVVFSSTSEVLVIMDSGGSQQRRGSSPYPIFWVGLVSVRRSVQERFRSCLLWPQSIIELAECPRTPLKQMQTSIKQMDQAPTKPSYTRSAKHTIRQLLPELASYGYGGVPASPWCSTTLREFLVCLIVP